MTPAQKNGVWKTLAIASMSVNITGVTAWLMFAQNAVTHQDVTQAIEAAVDYPWEDDRGTVLYRLDAIEKDVHSIKDTVKCIEKKMQ